MEETKHGYPGGDCIVSVLTDEKNIWVSTSSFKIGLYSYLIW